MSFYKTSIWPGPREAAEVTDDWGRPEPGPLLRLGPEGQRPPVYVHGFPGPDGVAGGAEEVRGQLQGQDGNRGTAGNPQQARVPLRKRGTHTEGWVIK